MSTTSPHRGAAPGVRAKSLRARHNSRQRRRDRAVGARSGGRLHRRRPRPATGVPVLRGQRRLRPAAARDRPRPLRRRAGRGRRRRDPRPGRRRRRAGGRRLRPAAGGRGHGGGTGPWRAPAVRRGAGQRRRRGAGPGRHRGRPRRRRPGGPGPDREPAAGRRADGGQRRPRPARSGRRRLRRHRLRLHPDAARCPVRDRPDLRAGQEAGPGRRALRRWGLRRQGGPDGRAHRRGRCGPAARPSGEGHRDAVRGDAVHAGPGPDRVRRARAHRTRDGSRVCGAASSGTAVRMPVSAAPSPTRRPTSWPRASTPSRSSTTRGSPP